MDERVRSSISDEFGAVAEAENQVLVLLRDRLADRPGGSTATGAAPAETPQGAFAPTAAALAVIARLVVHLTRVRVINADRVVPLAVDYVLGVGVTLFVSFSIGWAGSNDIARMPLAVLVAGCVVLVALVGRIAVLVLVHLDRRHAYRFRRLARRVDVRQAVDDLFDRELPELIRWRELAEGYDRPALVDRLTSEITTIDNLRRDVGQLTRQDLDWALRARLDSEGVPKAGYRREVLAARLLWRVETRLLARLERLTAIPLTREGAMRAAAEQLDRRLRRILHELGEPPLARAGEGVDHD
jgi:hypothetical protein